MGEKKSDYLNLSVGCGHVQDYTTSLGIWRYVGFQGLDFY